MDYDDYEPEEWADVVNTFADPGGNSERRYYLHAGDCCSP